MISVHYYKDIAKVNPAAARVLNQSCYVDGFSKPCRLSTSSLDGFHHSSNSHISNTAENGEGGAKTISSHKPSTSDRSTQTEPWIPNHEAVPLALTRGIQSLSLEDALTESVPYADETRTKLRGEDEDADEYERGKDQTWSSIVEETIQPTTIRTLQQQQSKGSEDSQGSCPQTPTSSSPAPPKERTSSPHGGPLSPIREGEKMLCVDAQMVKSSIGWLLEFTASGFGVNPNINAYVAAQTKVTAC
ncbi:echinoderm microtubule-associated -like 3 [Labeo rohita]|uniref:Echinoderm microtubule-associated-like 3 n=1 Tax=Labeo rohita TaxID=84645 RepID=A0A498LCL8_LABRO|nr:echinoderm microtubule-associated -like 3 [Labeo rohita]